MFGGYYHKKSHYLRVTNSCLNFNTNDNSLKEICKMNVERMCAACAVFQGGIVVTGGKGWDGDELKVVEFGDEWTPLPDMINRHSQFVVVSCLLLAMK